jgi:RHS repeat-associated protein
MVVVGNPLVAEVKDSTKAYTGSSLLESAFELKSAIESGDWASVALGAVGTALDALSMAMDPFGAILANGVGWLMEHVGPLKEALDALTGNADEITANSETWKNIATELGSVGTDLAGMVSADLHSWTGIAADTYRDRATDTVTLLDAAKQGCEGASSGVKTAGEVVAAVRALVRDIIAELIGHMISWALQVLFTLGIGLTWVVPQVVNAVAKTASKIANLTKKTVKALQALMPLLKRADDLFADAASALKKLTPGKGAPAPKPNKLDEGTTPKGSPDTSPNGDGSTTPSGSPPPKSDPPPPPKADPPPPPKQDGPRDRALPDESKVCVSDPVDVATGEVVMTQVDLTVPGESGDLVLSRTHLSSYRAGRWFGRSWASTMDQRLVSDGEHLRYFAEDGMVLVYPLPGDDAPVLPLEGPRHPLHRFPGGYRLSDGSRELHFSAAGRNVFPLTVIEQDGSRTAIEYTDSGAPETIRRDDGVKIQIYTADGRIVGLGAPGAAPLVKFGYNRLGQLSTIEDFAGRPMTLDYDIEDRLVGWKDRIGTWYRYVYDDDGRCVRTAGANGYFNAVFAYDTAARTTRHTDALGHTWTYRMNDAGQLIEKTDPLGNSRRYQWTRYDLLQSQVDELGRVTFYGYENGELATVTRPDGSVVRVSPVEAGVVLQSGDGTSAERAVVEAADPFAALPGVSAPLGADGPSDPLGDEQVTTAAVRPGDRDPFGRPRLVHTASGGEARLGWTAEGRRAWRIGPGGARDTWLYDAEGQVVEYRDAAGGVTRRGYGPFGLPMEDFDASGARTAYSYDGELRLTTVENPQGLIWRYTYDPAGRLVEEVDFDGRRLTYAYDEAGQLRRMTNGLGEVTEYFYDLLGNIVERRTATGATGYAYDTLGRLTYAVNADSVLEIVRDERGRVLHETLNGVGVHWTYESTSVRRRTVSGLDSEWRYDSDLPMSLSIAGHEVRFEYDDAGREIGRAVDGAAVLRQRFDAEDRLAEQVVAGLGRRGYAYRPDGRLAAVDDDMAGLVRFGFDQGGRVTEVHTPVGTESFSYDAAGNIVTAVTPSSAGPRVYRGNILLQSSGTRYSHDRQGRVTGRIRSGPTGEQEWRYIWDELDRLIVVVAPDGGFWTYLYDPLGRRFAKRRWVLGEDGAPRKTAETWFVWNSADLVEQVELYDDGTSRVLTWERHPGDSRPVVQIEQTGPRYGMGFRTVITSPAGTPTELIDEHGVLDWQARSSFWGEQVSSPIPLAFPGQYRDDETGLHYNVYRYYDPETARYLSQDPLGLAAALNPVGYVSEPLLAGDPLGLVSSCGKPGAPKAPESPAGGNDAGKIDPPAKKPDGLDEFRSPDGKIRPADMTDEQYAKFASKWDDMMKPGKDKSWFWSGGHVTDDKFSDVPVWGKNADPSKPNSHLYDPVTGKNLTEQQYKGSIDAPAEALAKKHGGNTLEGILRDNKVEMPGFNDGNPNAGKVWTDASKALGRNAEGEVHVALPNTPGSSSGWAHNGDEIATRRPNNVFDMDEFPILRHNPNVTKVIAHDVDYPDATPVEIWSKETH